MPSYTTTIITLLCRLTGSRWCPLIQMLVWISSRLGLRLLRHSERLDAMLHRTKQGRDRQD